MDSKVRYDAGLHPAPEAGLEVVEGPKATWFPASTPDPSKNPFYAPNEPHSPQSPASGYTYNTNILTPTSPTAGPGIPPAATVSPNSSGYAHTTLSVEKGQPPTREKIWGMRRRVFFMALSIVVFLVVAAIAIGLGVGLGTKHKS